MLDDQMDFNHMDEICNDAIRDDEHDGDEKMKIGEMLFVFLVKFTNKQKMRFQKKVIIYSLVKREGEK